MGTAAINNAVAGLLAGNESQALGASQSFAVSKANDLQTAVGQEVSQAIDQAGSTATSNNGHIDFFA